MNIKRCTLTFCSFFFTLTATAQTVDLSDAEQAWVEQNPTVTYCVDPDWVPFEHINKQGQHVGISADLLQLVASRVGLTLQLVPTATWPESMDAARQGRCQVLSFLNETPERQQWSAFTSPLLTEPNIIITREDHNFVADLSALHGQTVALPKGTSVAEHIASQYPNLKIILTETEDEVMAAVANRQADMAIRSLAVSAYTIRKQGLFMLKIAGRLPGFDNQLRMGVRLDQPMLLSILDKGVSAITPQERERILNQHVVINVPPAIDPRWLAAGGLVLALLLAVAVLWWRLSQRAAEQRFHLLEQRLHMEKRNREVQSRLVAMISHELRTPTAIISSAAQSLGLLLPLRNEETELRLQRIRAAVARIVGITEQFLLKDRVDQGAIQLNWGAVDPVALCANALQLLGEPRIQFHPPAARMVQADGSMLQVVFENLLRNALAYADLGTPIQVDITFRREDWTFSVRNQGECISPDKVLDIFEPYTRANAHPDISGTGLGLYLVRRVALHHQGVVALTCNTERTVEFTLTLPYDAGRGSSAVQA